jgi:hypothetical protein
MSSPTQRALKELRKRGWKVYITEKFNAFARIRQDAFGFGDLLGIDIESKKIVLVQVTSGANHAARITKIKGIQEAYDWIDSGGLILVMSFRKNSKGRYDMREEYLDLVNN